MLYQNIPECDISQISRVHFVGIGGAGLSAIAIVLLQRGYHVSGSDLRISDNTRRLKDMGARVYIGHAAKQITDAQMLIISSAIPVDNEELLAAHQQGLPTLKRHQVFSQLTAGHHCVAVAGTHGKTTTAAMISWILLQSGHDPSFIVGGTMRGLGTNARAGKGLYFVVEADEYDYAFLGLTPELAVVTHLELDHPDCFHDMEEMSAAFRAFLARVKPEGVILGCGDAPNLEALLAMMKRNGVVYNVESGMADADALSGNGTLRSPRVYTYGLDHGWDWVGRELRVNTQGGIDFEAWHGPEQLGRVRMSMPGVHNVRNALGAIAAAQELGVDIESSRKALTTFQGTERRFEVKGDVKGVTVIDDYAHHPTQVRATLAAARGRYKGRELWAVFQPHTFSRTRALLDDFTTCFEDADHVIAVDIYAAREFDDLSVSTTDIVTRIVHPDAHYIGELNSVVSYLLTHLQPDSVLITLGAGDVNKVGDDILLSLVGGRLESRSQ